jgi:hypothetical protein
MQSPELLGLLLRYH